MALPVLGTPRLTLRPIIAHDAEGLREAYGDADAMRHWDHSPSHDVSQTAERIRLSTRLALRRGRVPPRCDVQPAAHGMDGASMIVLGTVGLEALHYPRPFDQRSRPC